MEKGKNLSLIIPVFNRPDEVSELLESLCAQSSTNFEIIIVEDGSKLKCDKIVDNYSGKLKIAYYFKENSGPGPARNYGAEKAGGEYFIFLDSDVIVPDNYISIIQKELLRNSVDAFGGPDAAHSSFTPLQKAINYSMTSFLTTGGIRGKKKSFDVFYPRSFNMGISQKAFRQLGGFSPMRFGEDLDFSLRLIENGFKTKLFPEAFVYHKRRNTFRSFFKQVNNSGIARINLYKKHPQSLKLIHFFPAFFSIGIILSLIFSVLLHPLWILFFAFFTLVFFLDGGLKNKNLYIGLLCIASSYIQTIGYGLGFISAFWKRIILGHDEFQHFKHTFYK